MARRLRSRPHVRFRRSCGCLFVVVGRTIDLVTDTRDSCPVCNGRPRVLVALTHPMMRRFTLELLDRDHACWSAEALDGDDVLRAVQCQRPDLVILDASAFSACHCAEGCDFPWGRMVVVGPERDLDYRAVVLGHGAGGWVARDDVAEQLSAAMRAALGCTHSVCPPGDAQGLVRAGPQCTSVSRSDAVNGDRADDRVGLRKESL